MLPYFVFFKNIVPLHAKDKEIMSKQKVIISSNVQEDLKHILAQTAYTGIFVLTDNATSRLCLPAVSEQLTGATVIEIQQGDENKNLDTLAGLWQLLAENGANRKSLFINLGGGMITDLGGFAASTFKRGMAYINIPTTLLGAVDAAVGGKTGINFLGLKNEIGVINPADVVLIDTAFFKTLDRENLLSGFAEMLKHALIYHVEALQKVLAFSLTEIDYGKLRSLLASSVKIKEEIVTKDPTEQHIRKALNFGHTVGHALESFSHEAGKPVLHGYAVAYGMICELYLSHKKMQFPKEMLQQICRLIVNHYGYLQIGCKNYPRLYELMTHDKKNTSEAINFTLLGDVGDIRINQTASEKEIFEALDFYRDCVGI